MRAVITGATGAVGMALISEILADAPGNEILVLTNPGSSRNGQLSKDLRVTLRDCALSDYDAAAENLRDAFGSFDVFFHLAWGGTTGAGRNDEAVQEKNVRAALSAVRLAKTLGCRTFVGVGSQAEYGRVNVPLRSDTPAFPENAYGAAKRRAGIETKALANALGMHHLWFRILSVYGPFDGKQSLIMSLIRAFQNGETPKCTGGEQIWDYLYSGDAARALLLGVKALPAGETKPKALVYVLGSGEARPLKEYIETVRDAAAPQAQIDFGAIPYGEKQVMFLTADIEELTRDTGWRPSTDFAEGIRTIIERNR